MFDITLAVEGEMVVPLGGATSAIPIRMAMESSSDYGQAKGDVVCKGSSAVAVLLLGIYKNTSLKAHEGLGRDYVYATLGASVKPCIQNDLKEINLPFFLTCGFFTTRFRNP